MDPKLIMSILGNNKILRVHSFNNMIIFTYLVQLWPELLKRKNETLPKSTNVNQTNMNK